MYLQGCDPCDYSHDGKVVLIYAKKLVNTLAWPVIPAKYVRRVLPDDRLVSPDRLLFLPDERSKSYPYF
jgi:hypothetical protein